ncbi:glutathione s-transferase chloride channel, c-terminal [Trichoderma arundinaceum]|uniref:Glutathione s-transferase chloride channel, c-terminal n=1 Tax=Trichoderma arundinaceum TaxID=490622 RepID=A0A395NIC5_TRIAR|nr:glutathione s-transferase chloride channel, c-terminal [Trichoderma arundinaceum]
MATETIPTLHYLDIGRMGRGEVVRLFMRDAGIKFNDIRHAYDDTWPATSEKLKAEGITRTGKVPALLINGVTLNQHIPILRYLSRDIGRYDGETNHEKFQIDAVSDVYIDWRTRWVASLSGVTEDYKNNFVPQYYNVIAKYYSQNQGPYLLGDKITYADFAVYQSIDNDERIGTLPSELPEAVQKFREAFEARPSIAAYIEEHRVKKE